MCLLFSKSRHNIWLSSDQKDFVPEMDIIWCDTIFGYLNGQLLEDPWGGGAFVQPGSTEDISEWHGKVTRSVVSCHLFNKSKLFGTPTSVPFPSVFWCDAFYTKMPKINYFFVIITFKSMLPCCSGYVVSMLAYNHKAQCCAKCMKPHMVWHYIIWCDRFCSHTIWSICHTIWYELYFPTHRIIIHLS